MRIALSRIGRTTPLTAVALGAVTGLRTTAGPATLALRGRWGRNGRVAGLMAAAGELAFDKHPAAPPRSELPSLAGRMVSGAATGRLIAGSPGAGTGAACALATAYGSQRLRALVGERTGLPDALLGAVEDAVVIGVAATATRAGADTALEPAVQSDSGEPGEQGKSERPGESDESEARYRLSPLGAAARGIVAAAVGTAAMTTVQEAYLKLTGGEPSSAPEEMGRRIVEGVLRRGVPRNRRGALNQGMHMLYGTGWGLPFGLVAGSLEREPPASTAGAALGLTAWGASLVELPALGLSPPPWQQSPSELAVDLSMHLVFGASTAAVFRALS